ncbi:hypothetical protein [Rathayibacter sp. VKM Ac-2760]|uniref:hypothetical protein n=1 Tax=Rathayibacter sp. VKM Ac-2760 TaxID=2609253 RepID=UPI0013161D4F|nr:hypothetical protein [Rathayibacter sp. VKM Ac-2760]QHC60500.1 hypothetical protein GSU72_19510 [Rathayibacter sp. VKM Ac-2760]
MTALLRTWGSALARAWPAVLAWYLGGALVREAILALAAPLGPDVPLAAFLLLPIAVLARLVSYIGMFLAVRRAMPAFAAIAGSGVAAPRGRAAVGEFVGILLASIIPFFVLYGLLGLLQEDFASYANRAFAYSFGGGDFLRPGDGPLVLLVIVLAFAGRLVLKRFGPRLPRGAALVEIYLEAVWVFVAVSGIAAIFGSVIGWVQDRRIVRAGLDLRQGLRDLWDPIRVAVDGIDGLVPVLLHLLALPAAWLLVAGIVYTRELAAVAEERIVSARLEARLRSGAGRLPAAVLRQSHLVTDEWDDVYKPLSVAGRLILRSGPGVLAAYVSFYALLAGLVQWLLWGLTRAIGAHGPEWWSVAFPVVALAVAALAETARLTLLAAAFDRALDAWRRRRGVSSTVPAEAPAAASASARPPAR